MHSASLAFSRIAQIPFVRNTLIMWPALDQSEWEVYVLEGWVFFFQSIS